MLTLKYSVHSGHGRSVHRQTEIDESPAAPCSRVGIWVLPM